MSRIRRLMFVGLTFCAATAWGQQSANQPRIGYLYPAGGQTGCVTRITAGGQFLRGVTDVYISGQGVRASVIKYIRPLRNLQREQRQLLQKRLKEVRQKRLAELSPKGRERSVPARRAAARKPGARVEPATQEESAGTPEVKLPDHPLLYDLDDKSLRELAHVSSVLFFPRAKVQTNRQLAEMVLIEVTIEPDAEPGERELRFKTATGLTNPVVFQVGTLPEIRELEPNNRQAYPPLPNMPKVVKLPKDKALDLPVLLNGQIMPGDIDRFRFHARKGQRLVMEVQARSLIPYLADAVPGWFQATLALYDAQGFQPGPGSVLRDSRQQRIRAGDPRFHLSRARGFCLSYRRERTAFYHADVPIGRSIGRQNRCLRGRLEPARDPITAGYPTPRSVRAGRSAAGDAQDGLRPGKRGLQFCGLCRRYAAGVR
ncbi:MAG: hypothetical protein ACYTAO_18680 [Planctomycetota bacterium]